MSTRTSEYLNSLVAPIPSVRGGRQARDLRIEHAAGTQLLVSRFLDGVGYAGDAKDPRPVRRRSLYDVKKWMADYFPSARFRAALPETTLYFAFVNDKIMMPPCEAVPVPREDLWWLAAPGDTLLLSDGSTHHYISVYRVDMDAGRIEMLDPWPDRVFLRLGLNDKGVEAIIEAEASITGLGRRISITRDEFLRVAIGVITRDTPELIDNYLAYRPSARDSFDVQLAFGLSIMEAEVYSLARYAAGYFKTALRLAEAMHESEKALYVAARMYVALVMAVYREGWASDPLATKPFKDEVDHLAKRYSGDRLLAGARATELCSLGNAAGTSKDYTAGRRFLDIAVARFPDEEEPRRLRAKLSLALKDHQGALDDSSEALALNESRTSPATGTARFMASR